VRDTIVQRVRVFRELQRSGEVEFVSSDAKSFPIRLQLKGCRPEVLKELPEVYPDVWKSLCDLAGRSHISIDLSTRTILQEGPGGWHPLRSPEVGEQIVKTLETIARLPHREMAVEDGDFAVIILAGGTGTRFANSTCQKVLYPVLGIPALERSLDTCANAGVRTTVLVVGFYWQEVVDFVETRRVGCHYVYQPQPLGTGDAARRATWFLRHRGFQGTILLLAGDKVLSPNAIPAMMEIHRSQRSDMTLAVAAKNAWPNSGRVVFGKDQQALTIIERPDVIQRQMFRRIYELDGETVETDALLHEFVQMQPSEKKLKKGLGPDLWKRLHDGPVCKREDLISRIDPERLTFRVHESDGTEFQLTPEELEERCDLVNVSLYLFSSEALYWSMDRLQSLNAQGEFYLTDAAEILTQAKDAPRKFRVYAARLEDYDAAGFNTMQELDDIENHLRKTGLK